jgi:hypothetical protein
MEAAKQHNGASRIAVDHTAMLAAQEHSREEERTMPDDLTEKIQFSQNKFEQLVSRIPGYAGYKQKEQRREADKLLRTHVARKYEEQLSRLNEIQLALTSGGSLSDVLTLERANTKLQLLADRIKSASYGYAGLFDAIKVDEEVLDKLYDFDALMLDGVGEIATLLTELAAAVDAEEDVSAKARQLVGAAERLNTQFSQRQDIILE